MCVQGTYISFAPQQYCILCLSSAKYAFKVIMVENIIIKKLIDISIRNKDSFVIIVIKVASTRDVKEV